MKARHTLLLLALAFVVLAWPHLRRFVEVDSCLELFSKLAEFDGSVIADRTKGRVVRTMRGTSMNVVAISLANEIITGKRSHEGPRDAHHFVAVPCEQTPC